MAAQVPSLRASALNSVAQLLHALLLGDHGWTAAQQIVASKLPAAFKVGLGARTLSSFYTF